MFRPNNKIKTLYFSILVALGAFFAFQPAAVQAISLDNVGATIGLGQADLRQTVINAIKWFLGFVSLLAVVYVIYGGYLWLTSAGNEQKVEKAKQTILRAVIGMVIILLAWAIVSFVFKTTTNVTNSGGSGPMCDPADFCCNNPLDPSCVVGGNTFDITGIATCAARPDYAKKVPLSSAVSISFNTNLKSSTVQTAVEDTDPVIPNLEIKKCTDGTCSAFEPEPVQWPSAPDPVPAGTNKYGKIRPAVFSGGAQVGAAGNTIAEWVTKANTITFYHKSFSTSEDSPDNLYFEPNTTYRVIIPKRGASTKLQDINDRLLENCRKKAPSTPIEGEGIIGENCTVDDANGVIHWTFTTGMDGAGPPIDVARTVPTSKYLSGVGKPDRNVPRSAAVAVDFSGAIDPNSISTDNFRIFECTTAPNVVTGVGCVFDPANPLPPADFAIIYSPTGATIQLKTPKLFDAFTWYRAEVKDVYNLCGTIQLTNPFDWVFQTNATVPGVEQVYPQNGFAFACPATEVFIQYKTSMWRVDSGSTQCDTGLAGTYVTDGAMSPGSGRALHVEDDHDPGNPNGTCLTYAFTPTSIGLQPGQKYSLGVNSNLTIDINGTKLNYGDIPPANSPSKGPWSFTVKAPNECVQPPTIKKISPSQGTDGQCVSVIGNYFDPQGNNIQEAGDKLELATENQNPNDAWSQKTIVTTVKAGPLVADQDHNFKVTVDYPAPIGPVSSNLKSWRLNSGSLSQGPCLFGITPTSGPVGTQVRASGKNFGSLGGSSAVRFTGPGNNWDISSPSVIWNDTTVDSATVTAASGLGKGDVQVIDSSGNESNVIEFDVTPPPPGAGPKVEESTACILPPAPGATIPSPNPKKNEQQACINAWPSARFVGQMDISTLTTGNITLEECDASYLVCSIVPTAIIPSPQSFQLNPASNLTTSAYFRVTIGTGVKNIGGVPFAAPYIWRFKTKAGNTECPISAVVLTSCNVTYNTNFSHNLPAMITDSACNIISGSGLVYAWTNSEPLVCSLLPITTQPNICIGPIDPDFTGSTTVKVSTEGKTSNACRITHDPTFCVSNSNCDFNKYGEQCGPVLGTSTCVNNKCTPVINNLVPPDGKIGTWVTANGCWFGTYVGGTSKMVFTSGKDGLPPDPLICGTPGSTWTNEWVIREVPDAATTPSSADASTGPVQIVRGVGQIATSLSDYTVNTVDRPKLCKITPKSGYPNSSVTVEGRDFGATRDNLPQDNLRFTHKTLATVSDSSNPSPWTDKLITANVPVPTNFGAHNVVVLNNNVASNSLSFTILDPSAGSPGSGTCPPADACVFPAGACPASKACGYNNCCVTQPKILSSRPAQGDSKVCRNTQVQVTFDQAVNLQSGAVKYSDGPTAVNGRASVRGSVLSYLPGLLSAGADQKMVLDGNFIRSPAGAAADVTFSPTCNGRIALPGGVFGTGPIPGALCFKTSSEICALNQVVVTAGGQQSHTFFKANEPFFPYSAEAWPSGSSTPLAQIAGVYTWDWSWLIGDGTIASVTNGNKNADIGEETVTSAAKTGTTFAEATAKVTYNQLKDPATSDTTIKSGRAGVVVDICDNPATYTDTSFDLKLSYCRGNGAATLLPHFFPTQGYAATSTSTDPAPLKSYFFKESATSRDVIGMLIFDNPNLLSPFDWYSQRFPLDTGGSSSTVGGYPALKTGTTTYVGVANTSGGTLLAGGMMVVLDYSSNAAQTTTKSVYNQILNKIQFNVSMNMDDALKIIRDTKRKQDLAGIQLLVEAYKNKNGSYPNLAAGSFIVGTTSSVWPSWQNTLGNALGRALPADPFNTFSPKFCSNDPATFSPKFCSNDPAQACTKDADCGSGKCLPPCTKDADCGSGKCLPQCQINNPGKCANNATKSCLVNGDCPGSSCTQVYEASTCWSENLKLFSCPSASSIYLYESTGTSYSLFGRLEYSGSGSFGLCSFNYQLP